MRFNKRQRGAHKLSSEVGDADTPSGGFWDMAFKSDSSRNDAAELCILSALEDPANLKGIAQSLE